MKMYDSAPSSANPLMYIRASLNELVAARTNPITRGVRIDPRFAKKLKTRFALDAAPPGTRIVLVGLTMEDVKFNPMRFVRQELEIRGTLIYEHPTDYPVTIGLIASGKLAPGATATEPEPLKSAASLLEAMAAGKLNAKPIVSPQE